MPLENKLRLTIVMFVFLAAALCTAQDVHRGLAASSSYTSTSTSLGYTTQTYSTMTTVTQDRLSGNLFVVEMTPKWYEYVDSPRGDYPGIRFYQREVILTYRIRNISGTRMTNVAAAMRFLFRGQWTQQIVMKAGDLEPEESTYFTKVAPTEVQLDETAEPQFSYISASTPAVITTMRTITSLYAVTFTTVEPYSQDQGFPWAWPLAAAIVAAVALIVFAVMRKRSEST